MGITKTVLAQRAFRQEQRHLAAQELQELANLLEAGQGQPCISCIQAQVREIGHILRAKQCLKSE